LFWDAGSSTWKPLENEYFTDEDTGKQCYRDPTDGSVFEWDASKQAWFPKIDEDFLAAYQMQYGVTENANEKEQEGKKDGEDGVNEEEGSSNGEKSGENGDAQQAQENKPKKRKPDPPSWFEMEEEKNTNVYVQGEQTAYFAF
jgi:HIV Tat-specific factor 1